MAVTSRLWLDEMELTLDWQAVTVPIKACSTIELTADQEWCWCTDREGSVRCIAANVREILIDTRLDLIIEGTSLCWVKALDTPGTLWRKFY